MLPGWPVQILHSNDDFALIGGTVMTLVVIFAFAFFSAKSWPRLAVFSIVAALYSILSIRLVYSTLGA